MGLETFRVLEVNNGKNPLIALQTCSVSQYHMNLKIDFLDKL
jgi:hypothetical protein